MCKAADQNKVDSVPRLPISCARSGGGGAASRRSCSFSVRSAAEENVDPTISLKLWNSPSRVPLTCNSVLELQLHAIHTSGDLLNRLSALGGRPPPIPVDRHAFKKKKAQCNASSHTHPILISMLIRSLNLTFRIMNMPDRGPLAFITTLRAYGADSDINSHPLSSC